MFVCTSTLYVTTDCEAVDEKLIVAIQNPNMLEIALSTPTFKYPNISAIALSLSSVLSNF